MARQNDHTPRGVLDNIRRDLDSVMRRIGQLPGRLSPYGDIVADCNDALASGWYRAPSAANGPVTSAGGSLFVLRAASSALLIRQEYRRVFGDANGQDLRKWLRTSSDGGVTWTSWVLHDETDTGTQLITPTMGSGTIKYQRIGNAVSVWCFLSGLTLASSNAAVQIGTVPSGARPPDYSRPGSVMVNRNGYEPIAGYIASNGAIVVVQNSGSTISEIFAQFNYFT